MSSWFNDNRTLLIVAGVAAVAVGGFLIYWFFIRPKQLQEEEQLQMAMEEAAQQRLNGSNQHRHGPLPQGTSPVNNGRLRQRLPRPVPGSAASIRQPVMTSHEAVRQTQRQPGPIGMLAPPSNPPPAPPGAGFSGKMPADPGSEGGSGGGGGSGGESFGAAFGGDGIDKETGYPEVNQSR